MAGTYRSSGNNVAKNIARLAGGIHKKNTTEQRKAHDKKERVNASIQARKAKEQQKRKTISYKGKIAVKTEQGKQAAKTKGKLERQAIKGTSSRSSTLKSGNKPNNDMAVGKKKTTNPPTRKRVAKGNKF